MIEEIKLNESVSVYKTQIEFQNISQLISDVKLNVDIALDTKRPTPLEPGIQSSIVISTPAISDLLFKINNILFETFKLSKDTPYATYQWAYISENTNKYFGLHTHDKKTNMIIPPKWTYTYYLQMPDNLIGDDGKLVFQLDDGNTHMFLPKVKDLLIFPTTLLHAPMNNINSNIERIVLGGVWTDIDTNVIFKKRNKTLF